jgi:hypothetical protein
MSTGIRADAVSRRRTSGRSQIQRAYYAPLRPSGVTWRGRQLQTVGQHDLAYPVGVRRQAVAGGKLQARQVASPASRVVAMPREPSATVSRSADGYSSAGFRRARMRITLIELPGAFRIAAAALHHLHEARGVRSPVTSAVTSLLSRNVASPCEQAWRSPSTTGPVRAGHGCAGRPPATRSGPARRIGHPRSPLPSSQASLVHRPSAALGRSPGLGSLEQTSRASPFGHLLMPLGSGSALRLPVADPRLPRRDELPTELVIDGCDGLASRLMPHDRRSASAGAHPRRSARPAGCRYQQPAGRRWNVLSGMTGG